MPMLEQHCSDLKIGQEQVALTLTCANSSYHAELKGREKIFMLGCGRESATLRFLPLNHKSVRTF